METVAVIGSAGQLGTDVVRALDAAGYRVIALSHAEIEVTDQGSVNRALTSHRPRVVVNCAAYVGVDAAEDEPDAAFRVNATGALHVARVSVELGACCCYVSTNYVFDGRQDAPYREEDATHPLGAYGVSKLAGEDLVRKTSPEWLIVRVSGLFGRAGVGGQGHNFIETILAEARAGKPLKVVQDARVSPTYTVDAARGIAGLVGRGAQGIVHVANGGSCSWYDLARRAVELCGLSVPIEPILASVSPRRAQRPKNSTLDTARFAGLTGHPLPSWEDALTRYLAEKGYLR